MTEQLYPKPLKSEKTYSNRRWAVDYCLIYDGGSSKWTGYYHTRFLAKFAAFWNHNLFSYGGVAMLRENT